MRLAGLILTGEYGAGEAMPLLMRVAGQSLLERLILQLKSRGVFHIVLLADALPAELVALADRLGGNGLSIDIARTPLDAADRLHPDEAVLLVDGPMLVGNDVLDELCAVPENGLVVVPAAECDSRFERIDGTDHWLGLAKIDGKLLRDVTAGLGDWAFAPTLLRRAVQMSAVRLGLLADRQQLAGMRPLSADDLEQARQHLYEAAFARPSGWLSVLVSAPARWIVRRMAERNIAQAWPEAAHALLMVLALGLGWANQDAAALLVFALSLLPRKLARCLGQLTGRVPFLEAKARYGMDMVLGALLLLAVLPLVDPLAQALVGGAIILRGLGLHMRRHTALLPRWGNEPEGLALVAGVGIASGWPMAGLYLVIALLLAEQFWQQKQIETP